MQKKIRLAHLIVQPVLVIDDGEELIAGPELKAIQLSLSQLDSFIASLPIEIEQLTEQLKLNQEKEE